MNTEIDASVSGQRPLPKFAPPRPSNAVPYENCIAAYIVGKLALLGWMHSDGLDELQDVTESVAEWLVEALSSYGWEGDIQELVHAGDLYRLMLHRNEGGS